MASKEVSCIVVCSVLPPRGTPEGGQVKPGQGGQELTNLFMCNSAVLPLYMQSSY